MKLIQIAKTCWINPEKLVYLDTEFLEVHVTVKLDDGSLFYVEEEYKENVLLLLERS